jgi:glycosyltransferase involved in cell wall biosynthesis
MEKGRYLVSIAMPVMNVERTILPAIRSILRQTYRDWECILIDDGSSDDTINILRTITDSRIRLYSDGTHKGLAVRLDEAVALSRGYYFARMDGDDIAYPTRLERQIGYLEDHPEVDLLGSWIAVFGFDGALLGKRAGPELHSSICRKPYEGFPIAHPTYCGRISWFRKYGYRVGATRCEDQDLLLRSYLSSRFANVPDILLGYREETLDLKKILKGRMFFLKALMGELRRQGKIVWAIPHVLVQALKAMTDCFAVFSGLKYHVLRHRALPITAHDRLEWERVWRLVN